MDFLFSLIALAVTSTSADLAPGEAPRCVPACGLDERCLETSTGYHCLSDRPPAARRATPAAEVEREEPDSGVRLILSAERLFGWGTQTTTVKSTPELETEAGYFAVFRGSPYTPYASPRIALDVKIPLGLTFGGSGSVVSTTLKIPMQDRFGVVTTEVEELGVLLSARAGYHIDVGSFFAVWLRAGVSWVITERSGSGAGSTALAFTPEAAAILRFNEHAGIAAGFVFDLPLSGSVNNGDHEDAAEFDLKLSHSAFTVGVVLAF
jgi:hypothetical protein